MTKSEYKKCISEALCPEYLAMFPQIEEEHVFSERFERRMESLIRKRRKPYYYYVNTAFKRVAVIFIVFVAASVTTILSVKAFRDFFKDFLLNIFSDHSHIAANDFSESESDSIEIVYPKTIRTKYDITADMSSYERNVNYEDKIIVMLSYTNGDTTIDFEQLVVDKYDEYINTEGASIEHIDINGHDAVGYMDNHNCYCLIWNNGEYVISISANIDKNELIELAKSVKSTE